MRIRSLLFAALVAVVPSLASAAPVLRAGEFSVGAEVLPSEIIAGKFIAADNDAGATPSTGFNLRYALDNRLALIGTLGFDFVTQADDADDPAVSYSVGVGGQFNLVQSQYSAFFFRGGLQFVPRLDKDGSGRELGVRLWAGPGVEARVAEPLSIQFYTAMLDLQFGGATRFDITVVPSIGLFLYF